LRRWPLSKRYKKKLIEEVKNVYGVRSEWLVNLLSSASTIEKVVEDDIEMYLVDRLPALIRVGDTIVPHLKLLLRKGYDWLPYIIIDEGAVRPISRGADLMRPGVVSFVGDYNKGDIVVIVDPNHKLPLAVHKALTSRKEAEGLEKGKIAESLHHVGDKYWKLSDRLT